MVPRENPTNSGYLPESQRLNLGGTVAIDIGEENTTSSAGAPDAEPHARSP